jgi:hypothetical protein
VSLIALCELARLLPKLQTAVTAVIASADPSRIEEFLTARGDMLACYKLR